MLKYCLYTILRENPLTSAGVLNELLLQISVLMLTAPGEKSKQMVRTDMHSDNS